MNALRSLYQKDWFRFLLFFIGVLLFTIFSSSQAATMGARQAIEIYGNVVLCQFLAAVVCLRILIPQLLNKGKTLLFILALLILTFLLFALYSSIRTGFLEIKYYDYYQYLMPEYIQLGFWERLFDFRLLLSKGITYLTPTALILLISYYNKQQKLLTLNEQKKTAELSTLKNQLNPHFLFNTLNNLYTLALQKSDKTPEVISKLSDILDYMLYRCNEKYVSLGKEIELIENYLTLEKIRYGKRANITFDKSVNEKTKIAPLILLTFVENAFKHGVSQEINEAKININLSSTDSNILFTIDNTVPSSSPEIKNSKNPIGLINVKKQLELLYPGRHELMTDTTEGLYSVSLKLDLP